MWYGKPHLFNRTAYADGDSCTELALCEWDEDDLLLVKCVGEGSGMKDWHDGPVMLGSIMTVKFRDSDGNLACVSSDDMPGGTLSMSLRAC